MIARPRALGPSSLARDTHRPIIRPKVKRDLGSRIALTHYGNQRWSALTRTDRRSPLLPRQGRPVPPNPASTSPAWCDRLSSAYPRGFGRAEATNQKAQR